MKFKTKSVLEGYDTPHDNLVLLIEDVEAFYLREFKVEPLMTSSARTRAESLSLYVGKHINPKTGKLYITKDVPYSVHETIPLRGADLRSRILTEEQNLKLVKYVNDTWVYNPRKKHLKCCMFHKVGDNAYHLHLQVHDKTVRRLT